MRGVYSIYFCFNPYEVLSLNMFISILNNGVDILLRPKRLAKIKKNCIRIKSSYLVSENIIVVIN